MKNNYLNYIIYGLLIIVVGAGIYLLIDYIIASREPEIVFKLNGEEVISHNLGDPYIDSGITLTENGVDISQNATIVNNVDVNKEGTYIITYQYNNQSLSRTVNVKVINNISLNGDEIVYLLLNGKYEDPKANVLYESADVSDQVKVDSDLDTSIAGKYTINYSYDKLEKKVSRNVYVSDFSEYFKVDYDNTSTLDNIELKVSVDNSKVSKYILPDNTETDDNTTFKVTSNGTYKFVIYDKYNNSLEKEIIVNNIRIINPISASCKVQTSNGKTTVTVTANNNITKYVYNGTESTSSTHTFDSIVNEVKVKLYDSDNQTKDISCKSELGTLEIHFINSDYCDDSILIRSNNTTIYIDGGRGATKTIEYLNALKIKNIDYVIGSHTEYDHIIAHAQILRKYKVSHVIYPDDIYNCSYNHCGKATSTGKTGYQQLAPVREALKAMNLKPTVQKIPSKLELGDMTIYFIEPISLISNVNDNSFVFILQFGNNKFMFTGDSGGPLNKSAGLISRAKKVGLNNIKVDVVKYPHHGNHGLTDDFINATNAKYYIVPNIKMADKPNSNFRSAMQKRGVKVYRQSDSRTGNILITSDGTNIKFTMDVKASTYAR